MRFRINISDTFFLPIFSLAPIISRYRGFPFLSKSKFISGEISERTTHIARELGIDYFACGHHATERGGIQALGEIVAQEYGLPVTFIDIENPA